MFGEHAHRRPVGVDDGTGQGNANPDRVAQAEALSAWVDGTEEWQDSPVLLLGDFNAAGGDSIPWRVLRDAGFEDAHDVASAQVGEDIGTFPDYGTPETGGIRIDWILVRDLVVEEYAARVPLHGGRAASDHATVTARVRPTGR